MDTYGHEPPDHTTAGNILVIDDDVAVLIMLTEVLRDHGYSVASASTPELAQRLIHEFRPHLAIIGTYGWGSFARGWHLAALFRQHHPGLPLLMISTSDAAVAEVGVTPRGRNFDAALLKPFRIRELVAHIEFHLQHSLLNEP